jgi:peptidoglycan/LPS O-acetylase OafA/YrhL
MIAIPHTAENSLKNIPDGSAGSSHIPSLDGLRAISIVLVLAGHSIGGGSHSFAFKALFLHADLGVRIFFVISGFLITSLLLNERAQSGNISLDLFYIRRALRILPAFFLFVGCIALLSVFHFIRIPTGTWVYVLTYTVNFAPFPPFPWVLIHLWSLSVEEQFYLLWPLVMKIFRLGTCVVVAILAIFVGPASHVVHRLIGINLPGYGPFPYVCGPIAMGCLLAMWAPKIRSWILSSKVLSDGRVLLFALLPIALVDAIPDNLAAPRLFLEIITNSMLTLCVARLVFIPSGLASRVLNSAPLVLIGKLSYSLYLWQELFLNPNPSNVPISTPFPINFVLILAAASLSYWGLEVRFLQLRKKLRAVPKSFGPDYAERQPNSASTPDNSPVLL